MLQWNHRYGVIAALVLVAALLGYGGNSFGVGWGW